MKVHFWDFVNGDWVKLTLGPGDKLEHFHGYRHEEGCTREWNTWKHTGAEIIHEWASDGTDCDGRLSRDSTSRCALDRLHSRRVKGIGAPGKLPKWEKMSESQRDYAAEAMGY